jgi:hypothetical protein
MNKIEEIKRLAKEWGITIKIPDDELLSVDWGSSGGDTTFPFTGVPGRAAFMDGKTRKEVAEGRVMDILDFVIRVQDLLKRPKKGKPKTKGKKKRKGKKL